MIVFQYSCQRCCNVIGKVRQDGSFLSYEDHIKLCWPNGQPGIDYVECKLCKFAGSKITQHVKNVHGISKDDYIKLHGPVIASASSSKYKASNNFDWINRAKANGDDLSEYRKNMSESVRSSIMEDPAERKRRSDLLATLNKRDDFRKRASDVAKITSARPEIIAARTKALNNWRIENFEEFYEKCVTKFLGADTKFSKPERILGRVLSEIPGYNFKYSQSLKSTKFAKYNVSQRKQIDFGDKELGVYVEFDGYHHFHPAFKMTQEEHENVKAKDKLLNELIEERGLTLIRISYDQFKYNPDKHFIDECFQKLFDILKQPASGVYFIGAAYETL